MRITIRKSNNGAIQTVFIFMFSLLPIIDSLNGFFEGKPIGSIYKILLICFLTFILFSCSKKITKKSFWGLIGMPLYVFLSCAINFLLDDHSNFNSDFAIKFVFNILMITLLMEIIKRNIISASEVYIALDIGAWLTIACFLAPYLLGVGNYVYDSGLGYKAFFIAQNEIGVILVIFCFFVSYKLCLKFSATDVLQLGLLIVCCMLLNTKTAIIASLVAIILWIIVAALRGKLFMKIATIIAGIISILLLKNTISEAVFETVNRYNTLTENYYANSVITGILSNRNYFLNSAIKQLNERYTLTRIFIGNGFRSNILIEMDLFDIFFYLGLIGIVTVVVFLAFGLKKTLSLSKTDHNYVRLIAYLIIICISFFAGHVLFMAMSGCYFCLFFCFATMYESTRNKEKSYFHKQNFKYKETINNFQI